MIRISTIFFAFLFALSFTTLTAQNRDLRFHLNPLPDTAMIGDTLLISGFIINDGPGSFVIKKNKPLVHLQGVPLSVYGTVPRKPEITEFSHSQGATIIQNGDSLGVSFPLVLSPAQMNATGGGGGLDIVIIIWPSRAYDPIDPNHDNNTDTETIYLKPYALTSFTTSLSVGIQDTWKIYPNPADHSFTLSIKNDQPITVRMINEMGQTLENWQLREGEEFNFPVGGYPRGIYHLQLLSQEGISTQTLILQ